MHIQSSHEGLVGAFQYLRHLSLAHVVATTSHHGHTYAVAVHSVHSIAFCHQYGLTSLVGQECVLAVGFASKHSFHHLTLLLQSVAVFGLLGYVVVGQHGFQDVVAQHLGRMSIQSQQSEHLFQFIALCGMSLEQSHHLLHHLLLRDALGTLVLSLTHNTNYVFILSYGQS